MPGWQPLTGFCDPLATTAFNGSTGKCDFNALLFLVKNGITDLVIISTLIVVVACIVAGFKLITASMQGKFSVVSEVKRMFAKIVTGYAIILVAWVLVRTVLAALQPQYNTLLN